MWSNCEYPFRFRGRIEQARFSRDHVGVFPIQIKIIPIHLNEGTVKHFALKSMCAGLALVLPLTAAQTLQAAEDIPDLNGVWQWGRCVDAQGQVAAGGFGGGFNCMLLEEDDARLTERAK